MWSTAEKAIDLKKGKGGVILVLSERPSGICEFELAFRLRPQSSNPPSGAQNGVSAGL
jgi:hypothetical protein